MTANQLLTLAGLLVAVAISLFFSILTVSWYLIRKRLRKQGEKVKGEIVDYEVDKSGDGTYYIPIVRFATKEGAIVTVTSQEGGGEPNFFEKEVTVYYNTSDPQKVSIVETDASDFYVVILILFCLFALGLSVYHLFMHIMNW